MSDPIIDCEPYLGCATTSELVRELRARLDHADELAGLDPCYRTTVEETPPHSVLTAWWEEVYKLGFDLVIHSIPRMAE